MKTNDKTHIGSSLDDFLAEEGHDVQAIKAAALKRVEDYRAHLLALADRVEAATGPDRDLDAAIFTAIGKPLPHYMLGRDVDLSWDDAQKCFTAPFGGMQVRYEHPAYTASLDVAASVMPAGWWAEITAHHHTEANVQACKIEGLGLTTVTSTAPNECAARVAAGLRARAAGGVEVPS